MNLEFSCIFLRQAVFDFRNFDIFNINTPCLVGKESNLKANNAGKWKLYFFHEKKSDLSFHTKTNILYDFNNQTIPHPKNQQNAR